MRCRSRADLRGLPGLPGRSHPPSLLGLGAVRAVRSRLDRPGLSALRGLRRLAAHQHLLGLQVLSSLALHPHPAHLQDPSNRLGPQGQQDPQAPFHPIRLYQEDQFRPLVRADRRDRLGQRNQLDRPDQQRRSAAKQP